MILGLPGPEKWPPWPPAGIHRSPHPRWPGPLRGSSCTRPGRCLAHTALKDSLEELETRGQQGIMCPALGQLSQEPGWVGPTAGMPCQGPCQGTPRHRLVLLGPRFRGEPRHLSLAATLLHEDTSVGSGGRSYRARPQKRALNACSPRGTVGFQGVHRALGGIQARRAGAGSARPDLPMGRLPPW